MLIREAQCWVHSQQSIGTIAVVPMAVHNSIAMSSIMGLCALEPGKPEVCVGATEAFLNPILSTPGL